MKLTLGKAAEFMQASGGFDASVEIAGYSIDSRQVALGEVFFALKGARDGHEFVPLALERGAAAAVVEKDSLVRFHDRNRLLAVESPEASLQKLGAAVRLMWGGKIVGVTGSAGKTTTKELIAHVLGAKFRTHKSAANFNNHLGVPLQLLKLESEHEAAVIEMGMSHAGEIKQLAAIVQPEIGVVTNVAPVHLEHFDSICGIARAKYELIESLPGGGVAVLNGDDEYVSQFGRDFRGRVIVYGVDKPADVQAVDVKLLGPEGSAFTVVIGGQRYAATLPLAGRHNILNALAAVAAGLAMGIEAEIAVARLASAPTPDKRGERIEIDGATVIDDCYNSNPKALVAMCEVLAAQEAGRRIVVAGEMLELGPEARAMHEACGRAMGEKKIDVVLGVQGEARHLAAEAVRSGARGEFVETAEEAGAWLIENLRAGDVALVKGSHGVHLERAIEAFKTARGIK